MFGSSLNSVTTRDKRNNNSPSGGGSDNKTDDVSKLESAASDSDIVEVVFVVDTTGIVHRKPVKTDIQDINYIEIKRALRQMKR